MLKGSALRQVCQKAYQGVDRSMKMHSEVDEATSFYDVNYLSSQKVFCQILLIEKQPFFREKIIEIYSIFYVKNYLICKTRHRYKEPRKRLVPRVPIGVRCLFQKANQAIIQWLHGCRI